MDASNPKVRLRPAWHGITTGLVSIIIKANGSIETYKEPHAGTQKSGRVSVKRSWRVDMDGMMALGAKVWRNHLGMRLVQSAGEL